MPNHVTTIPKSSNKDLINLLKDFNQIIPQPQIFNEFGYGVSMFFSIHDFIEFVKDKNLTKITKEILKELANDFKQSNDMPHDKINDEYILQAYCYFQTGCIDPLEWSRKYWGTKWNSYSFELTEEGCKFDTAWTHPLPVISKLSEMYPDELIEVHYADEDIGCNLGAYRIQEGYIDTIFDEDMESKKDREWFAMCIKGIQDDYTWSEKDNEYMYKE